MSTTPRHRAAVAPLKHAVQRYLKRKGLNGPDVHYYSKRAWQERGEPFGNDAPLSMTFEGGLNHVLNYPETRAAQQVRTDLEDLAHAHGFWWEQGYAWSLHFYAL
jgi:hypothetical protein